MRRAVKAALVAALVTGCSAVATSPASAQGAMITTYERVNVRDYPTSKSAWEDVYPANFTVLGLCWDWGETITDNGYTNDVWVATGKKGSRYSYWVSAVYLKGDKYGGLSVENGYCWDG